MVKKCFKCNEEKSLIYFYDHKGMSDGKLNKCKECTKKDVSNYSIKNNEKIKIYEKKRSQTIKRKLLNNKNTKQWRKLNPEKWSAQVKVNNAIRSGYLLKKTCEVCGKTKAHAHHDDYSKPLVVIWLCPLHHKERHKLLSLKD